VSELFPKTKIQGALARTWHVRENLFHVELTLIVSKSLDELVADACGLAAIAFPHTNAMVQILTGMNAEERERYKQNDGLDKEQISVLARRIGFHPETVFNVLDRQVKRDLVDYSSIYDGLVECYRNSGIPDSQISSFLDRNAPCSVVFVLHEWLEVWSPESESLDDFFIEDLNRSDIFAHVVKGYLLSIGLGYPTILRLLCASYNHEWANWQALWAYF